MLTVLLYIYQKVVFMQYCVSVGCGVVSLTKGTSGLPIRNCLSCHMQLFCQLVLRHPFFSSVFANVLSDIAHVIILLMYSFSLTIPFFTLKVTQQDIAFRNL